MNIKRRQNISTHNIYIGPAPAVAPAAAVDVKAITKAVMEECSKMTLAESNKQKEKVSVR